MKTGILRPNEGFDIIINGIDRSFRDRKEVAHGAARYLKQRQPKDIVEAAGVDGAKPLAVFRELTLPHLRRYIELGVVLGAIYLINEFDAIYMMTQGGPGISSANLPFYIYQRAFLGFQVGQAAAMGVVVVVATIIIATFALRLIFTSFSGTEQAA
jgi:sorbitol/mannitol transport system permease protein